MKDYKEHSKYIEKLGKKVRLLRKQQSLTQHDLAAITDIPRGQIVKIETGTTNVTIITLLRLAKAFKMEISELVDLRELNLIIKSAKNA